jgi:hypothetical protein
MIPQIARLRKSALSGRISIGLVSSLFAWLTLGRPKLSDPWGTGDLTYQYVVLKFFSEFPSLQSTMLGYPGMPLGTLVPESFLWQVPMVAFTKLGASPIFLINLFFLLSFFTMSFGFLWLSELLNIRRVIGWTLGLLISLSPWHFQRISHPYLAECSALVIGIGLGLIIQKKLEYSTRTKYILAIVIGLSNPYWMISTLLVFLGFFITSKEAVIKWELAKFTMISLFTFLTTYSIWQLIFKFAGYEWGNYSKVVRQSIHSEIYAGKLTSLLFPSQSNLLPFFSSARIKYDIATGGNENANWISIVSLLGFIVILIWIVKAFMGSKLENNERTFALIFIIAFTFYTVGGFGSVIAFAITPIFRAWNRLFFLLQILEFIAIALILQKFLVKKVSLTAMLGVIILFAATDFGGQLRLNRVAVPDHAARIHQDALWVNQKLEINNCKSAQIFPFTRFPGDPYPGDFGRNDFENYDNMLISYYGHATDFGAILDTDTFNDGMKSRELSDLNSFQSLECLVIDNGVSRSQQNDFLLTSIKTDPRFQIFTSPNQRWSLIQQSSSYRNYPPNPRN